MKSKKEGMIKYYRKLISGLLIIGGSFLLLEHLFTFEGFDIELIGHEFFGLAMIAIAFLVSIKWKQLPAFIEAIRRKDIREILDKGERGE